MKNITYLKRKYVGKVLKPCNLLYFDNIKA